MGASGFDLRKHLDTPELNAFREEVRSFIRENLPEDIRAKVADERMDLSKEDLMRWHKILAAKGWACPAWPKEHGGCGWSDEEAYIFEREIALADAPRHMFTGVGMLAPCVIEFGTQEQKDRFLPPIANGDVMWCQGFSEPNAGSDLAALQSKAVRDGDDYILNGSKIWTTDAHMSDWIFGLFRTDGSGKKQHGISFFLFDMNSPGVSVQPIVTYDGGHEVNQTFFEDVRVPANQLLGEENQGWAIAKFLLGLERFGTAEVSRSMVSLARLKEIARTRYVEGRPLIERPEFAERLADAEIELKALELTEMRFLFGPGGADALGAEASMLKVRGTEVQHEILELALEALGPYAHVDVGDPETCGEVPVGPDQVRHAARAYFNYRKTAIYSGSNEIMKNIVSKIVLGL